MRRYFSKIKQPKIKNEQSGIDEETKQDALSRVSEMPALHDMSATQILQAYSEALDDLQKN